MWRRKIDIAVYSSVLLAWAILAVCEHYARISSNNFTLGAVLLGVFVTIFAFARRKVD